MALIVEPKVRGQRLTYHVPELPESFTSINPPLKEGYDKPYEKGNTNFFLNYRKTVLSKYLDVQFGVPNLSLKWYHRQPAMVVTQNHKTVLHNMYIHTNREPPMYKWGEVYDPYTPHPKVVLSHRKQRWEEMFSKPNVQLTFKDQSKMKEINDFYLLCQFQRQYYNDYTGHTHPMDYFERDFYKWASPPDFNSTYVQFPEMYVKYRQPVVLPLTTKRAWIEPAEPCRRLAGKYDPYPDLKFPR